MPRRTLLPRPHRYVVPTAVEGMGGGGRRRERVGSLVLKHFSAAVAWLSAPEDALSGGQPLHRRELLSTLA